MSVRTGQGVGGPVAKRGPPPLSSASVPFEKAGSVLPNLLIFFFLSLKRNQKSRCFSEISWCL